MGAQLLGEGVPVVTFDISTDNRRLRLALDGAEPLAALVSIEGEITDLAGLEAALPAHRITNIIHLAVAGSVLSRPSTARRRRPGCPVEHREGNAFVAAAARVAAPVFEASGRCIGGISVTGLRADVLGDARRDPTIAAVRQTAATLHASWARHHQPRACWTSRHRRPTGRRAWQGETT